MKPPITQVRLKLGATCPPLVAGKTYDVRGHVRNVYVAPSYGLTLDGADGEFPADLFDVVRRESKGRYKP